jgi:hypothetical protein
MKLKSSIPSNSVKLIDLYNKIISGSLITGPDFQRKELVWKKQHKFAFIETILLNFPFPEVYIASADLDLNELKSKEVVVDGQQRLTTIVDYIQGRNDFINQKSIKSFDDLDEQEKKDFLNYLISVKDLKDLGKENIKEVFKRINSTNYSLNSNEVLNAEYGGGEFAIFCKMLADKNYNPTLNETAIIIPEDKRLFINSFFEKYKVFSDNDIKRMFDSQYIMLICSTLLEGGYFGRSTKINDYLQKYNGEFTIFNELLEKIYSSLIVIDQFGFSDKSYWFNKANLFTLIIELVKNKNKIDNNILENKLIELENKVDIYFMGEEKDMELINSDEAKYFEVARQGSHELANREHRGKVIKNILVSSSLVIQESNEENESLKEKNIKVLKNKYNDFSKLTPTETGLTKGIMDATSSVREFLKAKSIHDYSTQEFGPLKKVKIDGFFVNDDFSKTKTEISLYRSNGRGDFRIWFTDLKDFAQANDELLLIIVDNHINILNSSKYDYSAYINSL